MRRRFQWHPSGTRAVRRRPNPMGSTTSGKCASIRTDLRWVSAERLTTGAGPDVVAALSRDGTRLAFTTEQGSTRLWVFPLDPVGAPPRAGKPLTEDDAMAKNSALSPDGQLSRTT